jgi:hypothetical protein
MNLLAPQNLARIREALAAGPIFGYWRRAHSGMGLNHWMPRDFVEFEQIIAQAKPGDYYVIWSLPAQVEKGVALAAACYDDQPEHGASLLSAGKIQTVERYLSDPAREYFGVFSLVEIEARESGRAMTAMAWRAWWSTPSGITSQAVGATSFRSAQIGCI